MSFNSKDSKRYFFTKNEECMTNKETHIAAADKKRKRKSGSKEVDVSPERTMRNLKEEVEGSGSSMNSPPKEKEERQETTIFTVLQKNTRSMSSSERLEELFSEVYRVRWDVILISETWRQGKEIWEPAQGHIVIESGKFTSKHGVAIILNRRWKNQINWVECVCERVVAASISVNKQQITLVSVYLPHSGYPDHHVERTYKTISKIIDKEKNMKIIGGDFNAELGPGDGVELSCVGHDTLNKANCRGDWMTQWLLEKNLVALNTMYKKLPYKQVTYHAPKGGKKQLDYILTDRKTLRLEQRRGGQRHNRHGK